MFTLNKEKKFMAMAEEAIDVIYQVLYFFFLVASFATGYGGVFNESSYFVFAVG